MEVNQCHKWDMKSQAWPVPVPEITDFPHPTTNALTYAWGTLSTPNSSREVSSLMAGTCFGARRALALTTSVTLAKSFNEKGAHFALCR